MSELPWVVLVYRVPTEPASKRVGVWRELKRIGALYLQQCVCIFPDRADVIEELDRVTTKILAMDGEYTLFDIPKLRPADEEKIVQAVRDLRNKEYGEIVEECETKFVKEIEFEHFRQNYTFEEAEEIGQDLEKIRRWFARIVARDWFGADRRGEVEVWIEKCDELLNGFEQEVYRRTGDDAARDSDMARPVVPVPGVLRRVAPEKQERESG
jgi:hypothetical protein